MVKVSIVIPAYHSAKYINKLLDSLAQQVYQDFEVIVVVDDHDYDSTICMIRSHKIGDKTIIFGTTRKTSPAKARNSGVKHCVGEYIAFCDADDWWDPLKLDYQLEYMLERPYLDMTYTRAMIHDKTKIFKIVGDPYERKRVKEFCPVPFSSVMVKRVVAEEHPFNERLKACDDYAWLLDLTDDYRSIAFIPAILTHILDHEDNLTTGNPKADKDVMRVHLSRGEYYTGIYKYLLPRLVSIKKVIFK